MAQNWLSQVLSNFSNDFMTVWYNSKIYCEY